MSVIIRLQNLPWSANSYDIRQYFQGLSIPEGGVHIVGGELGDAFIAFSTDEDARQAMMRSGGKLKEVQVSLLLSSRSEMQRVIEAARSVTLPPVQPPAPLPPIPPPPTIHNVRIDKENDSDSREVRKRSRSRSRSRSRGRSRNDRRDVSSRRKRSRSRSRDRRDSRRDDRRKRRSRSRSTGRDRYGRDIEKREVFSRDKRDRSREKHDEPSNSHSLDGHKIQQPAPKIAPVSSATQPTLPPMAPIAANIPRDPFGLQTKPAQLPFIDDRLTAAMKSTLSALNLPIPIGLEKPNNPPMGADVRREQPPPMGQFGMENRQDNDGSRGRGIFPDPSPAFGLRYEAPPPSFGNQFQQWGNSFQPSNEPINNAWPPKNNTLFPPMVPPVNPLYGRNDNKFGEHMGARPDFNNPNSLNGGPNTKSVTALMDDDFRPRFFGPGTPFEQKVPEQGNFNRFENTPNVPRESRQSRFEKEELPPNRRNFERQGFNDESDRQDMDGRRDNFNQPRGGYDERNNLPPNSRKMENDRTDLYGEILNCPDVFYKDIRRAFSVAGYPLTDIKFIFDNRRKRVFVKFSDSNSKSEVVRSGKKVRIESTTVAVSHITEARYYEKSEEKEPNDRSRWHDKEDGRRSRRHDGNSNDNENFGPMRHDKPVENEKSFKKTEESKNNRENNIMKSPPGDIKPIDLGNGISPIKSKRDCVFITNLPRNTTDRDVFDFFSDIGITPKKLHLMLGSDGEPSGEAYVEFWHPQEAVRACIKSGSPMGRSTVIVRLEERSAMIEAVGLDPESNDQEQQKKILAPSQIMPWHAHGQGGPQRLMDVGTMSPPQFHGNLHPPRFPPEVRFMPNNHIPPSPNRVVVLHNIPYRAEPDEIIDFLGPTYQITIEDIFRKLNDRGQPTSEARVVMPNVEDAVRAINTLNLKTIRDRPITMNQLSLMKST